MYISRVLDMGFDYGAEGGRGWFTNIIGRANGHEDRNEAWQDWLGAWQLGNRNIDRAKLAYLRDFIVDTRGRAHSFAYKDWNDYLATEEALTVEDDGTARLVKNYGTVNPYACRVTLPKANTVVLQQFVMGAWATLTPEEDYELAATGGVLTPLGSPPPWDEDTLLRWSGEFYVHARFDVEMISAVFLAWERRGLTEDDHQSIFDLGSVTVREDRRVPGA